MVKKITLISLILFFCSFKSSAQVYGPNPFYSGIALLYFPNGVFQGYVLNGRAEGLGTYYMYDGSIFQGNFSMGFQNGPGVAISKIYGYVAGCWNGGNFIGPCQNSYNPYLNQQTVQNVVYDVKQNVVNQINQNPQTTTPLPSFNPTDYTVTQLADNSQLGKQVASSLKQ